MFNKKANIDCRSIMGGAFWSNMLPSRLALFICSKHFVTMQLLSGKNKSSPSGAAVSGFTLWHWCNVKMKCFQLGVCRERPKNCQNVTIVITWYHHDITGTSFWWCMELDANLGSLYAKLGLRKGVICNSEMSEVVLMDICGGSESIL